MDTKKIGIFLSELRKEQNLTQEQLGERLGVRNKTVSRWENGNYLPPAEMLQALSDLYGISINEILSGERLSETGYREKAEENIKSVISSSFTLKEKIEFYKLKWKKDHRTSLVVAFAVYMLLLFLGSNQDSMQLILLATMLGFAYLIFRRNAMMIYVEGHAFDPPSDETEAQENKQELLMKRVRITALILLAISVWVFVDLTYNYFSALVPEINDGITVRGFWSALIFGVDGYNWGILNYFEGFITSLRVMAALGIGNIILAYIAMSKAK